MKYKKILYILAILLCVMGFVGGVGYALYGGSWPIALGVVVLACIGFPTVKKWWKILSE